MTKKNCPKNCSLQNEHTRFDLKLTPKGNDDDVDGYNDGDDDDDDGDVL